jgi:hypothetical protein
MEQQASSLADCLVTAELVEQFDDDISIECRIGPIRHAKAPHNAAREIP